jgi:hypothetical protein
LSSGRDEWPTAEPVSWPQGGARPIRSATDPPSSRPAVRIQRPPVPRRHPPRPPPFSRDSTRLDSFAVCWFVLADRWRIGRRSCPGCGLISDPPLWPTARRPPPELRGRQRRRSTAQIRTALERGDADRGGRMATDWRKEREKQQPSPTATEPAAEKERRFPFASSLSVARPLLIRWPSGLPVGAGGGCSESQPLCRRSGRGAQRTSGPVAAHCVCVCLSAPAQPACPLANAPRCCWSTSAAAARRYQPRRCTAMQPQRTATVGPLARRPTAAPEQRAELTPTHFCSSLCSTLSAGAIRSRPPLSATPTRPAAAAPPPPTAAAPSGPVPTDPAAPPRISPPWCS